VKDLPRLQSTTANGRQHITRLISDLAGLAIPRIGIGLLKRLAISEILRATEMSQKTTPSDLCGQARFLRGLIVSQPLDPDPAAETGPLMEEAWAKMMTAVDELWKSMFWVERLEAELAKHGGNVDKQQVDDASVAATYGRTDIDMGFVEQVEERCREVFSPLDKDFVVPSLGVNIEQLLAGFPALAKSVERRVNEARRDAKQQSVPMAEVAQRFELALEVTVSDLPEPWAQTEKEAFLNAFSFSAGKKTAGVQEPVDDNITLRKPLLRLSSDRYLLTDPIFCRYAPFRLLCHIVGQSTLRDRYLRIRDEVLERRAGRLFTAAVGPVTHYPGVYLPVGDNGSLAEQDHIVIAGGRAFFIECKAKRVRSPAGHGGNSLKVRDDLRSSVQVAFEQGDRARRYVMQQQGLIPVLDSHGHKIGEIDRAGIETAHVIVVTWDSLCPLSVDLQPWLNVPTGVEYPWVVWVDDLQIALTRLRPAHEVARFIKWRSGLNGRLMAGEELHAVGYFLAGHIDLPDGYETIALDGKYGAIFDDDYFAAKGIQRKSPPPDSKPSLIRLANEGGRRTARRLT
jgi:hypothetical protein